MFKYFGPTLRQYVVVIVANLNVLSTGMNIGWASPMLVKLQDPKEYPFGRAITQTEGSWIVSVGGLSGLLGAATAGFLTSHLGRKWTIILAILPKIMAWLLILLATEAWMLLLGRIIGGFSDIIEFSAVPMLATEIASNKIRGTLGTMLQMCASLGIVTMLCIGPYLSAYQLNTFVLCAGVSCVLPMFFVPDSPVFLYKQGKKEEALKILTFFRGSEMAAQECIKEYELSESESGKKPKITELLRSQATRRALGIAVFLSAGNQLSGFHAVMFYLQTILVQAKTTVASELSSVVIGLMQLAASFLTACITHKFGRRPILCVTLTGMSIGLCGLGLFFKLRASGWPVEGVLQYLPLASLILVVFSNSAGISSLIWPLIAELFSDEARPFGMSVSNVAFMLSQFLITRYFEPINRLLGAAITYWMFAGVTIGLCLFVFFCVPETKDRSIYEIQRALKNKRGDDVEKHNAEKDLKDC